MARLDSIFPVNPEKHELIEITVRRIHLHGELKKVHRGIPGNAARILRKKYCSSRYP
ncbi:hypothetical protein DM47_3398 [Burkholderia mallei]|nr:hypothetical protein DM77_3392 [Burkholderia mallei]KOT20848.1 hypothetical protein DM47_3398 [Burkholderia mallei]